MILVRSIMHFNILPQEDWRSAVIVPVYKSKRKRTKCKNYRSISLFECGWKNVCVILVDRVRKSARGFRI